MMRAGRNLAEKIERMHLHRRARRGGVAGVGILFMGLALAACGQKAAAPPQPPGGICKNDTLHFSLTYPKGWLANVAPQSLSATPAANLTCDALTTLPASIFITRTGSTQPAGSLVSTFTISVLDAHNPDIAKSITRLQQQAAAPNAPLHVTKIAGLPAYQSNPVQQQLPNSGASDTHVDYYIITPKYEYALSTDSVQGDAADEALQAMLSSFTVAH
jgi:hypothetical protein